MGTPPAAAATAASLLAAKRPLQQAALPLKTSQRIAPPSACSPKKLGSKVAVPGRYVQGGTQVGAPLSSLSVAAVGLPHTPCSRRLWPLPACCPAFANVLAYMFLLLALLGRRSLGTAVPAVPLATARLQG